MKILINKILDNTSSNKDIAILFIAEILNKPKEYVLAHPETELSARQYKEFQNYLKDYKNSKPVAYILRNKEFYGRNYLVTQDTLIPRPETELLIDQALGYINHCEKEIVTILDIGTGSGCIPITLAAESKKKLNITSIDISIKALNVARKNKKTLIPKVFPSKILFKEADIFSFSSGKSFDLIISNPPYIPESGFKLLDKGIIDFEPSKAFLGGKDGLKFYIRIEKILHSRLDDKGLCLLEINSELVNETVGIFSSKWDTKIFNDMQGLPRVISISRMPC